VWEVLDSKEFGDQNPNIGVVNYTVEVLRSGTEGEDGHPLRGAEYQVAAGKLPRGEAAGDQGEDENCPQGQ